MRTKGVNDRTGARTSTATRASLIALAALPLSVASLVLATLALALAAPPAEAAPLTLAGWGHGAGKVNLPTSVAVNQSGAGGVEPGSVYVADYSTNYRIDRFGPAGDFQLAWGWGVADGKSQELQVCGPAAEPPTRRCSIGPAEISGTPEGAFGATGAGAVTPNALAVDQETGDVYVADASKRRVSKFTPAGQLLYMLGKGVDETSGANICTAADLEAGDECGVGGSGSAPGEFSAPYSLAVGPSGDLWVGDLNRLERFEAGGAFLSEAPVPGGGSFKGHPAGAVNALAATPAGNLVALRAATLEEQRITPPASGKYTLSFEGGTTKELAASAGASEVQKALGELPAIAPGDLQVSGGGSITVQFRGSLAYQDVEQIGSGGGSPATVTTLRDGALGAVEERDASGALLKTFFTGDPKALATDAAGDVYVGECGPSVGGCSYSYRFHAYGPAGEQISQFGAGQVIGEPYGNALAADHTGRTLYTTSSTGASDNGGAEAKERVAVQAFPLPEPGPLPEDQRAEDILPTAATLAAQLNPEGHPTSYRFEYGTDESYGSETPEETLPGSGYEAEALSVPIEGLTPDTTYHFRLVAENEAGTAAGEDTTFTTRPAVAIDAQWASALAAHDASVHAKLDPLGVAGKWWLEYGTSPCSSGGCAQSAHLGLPASFGDIEVAVALSGLEPSTAYFYRFVASDTREGSEYLVHGADLSFATQSATLGFSLADNRAWEMVSPPKKYGASIGVGGGGEGQIQAAANGEAIAYLSAGSIEAAPQGNRAPERSSALARRGAGGGWSSEDLTPPNAVVETPTTGEGYEYKLFDTQLANALLEPRTSTPLSPEATERTPYLRQNTASPSYTPLLSGAPGFADVPEGTEFGGADLGKAHSAATVRGATPSLEHVLLGSIVPLAKDASANALYEWTAAAPPSGRLQPVSVLPGSEDKAVEAKLGSGEASTRGAVSEDGSRVFWSAGPTNGNPTGLYLRDLGRGETLRLDAEQEGAFGTGAVEPIFQGASPDGAAALFTDTQNLTEDANEEGADLYRCSVVIQEGHLGCDLVDLTAHTENPENAFESAEVQGLLAGMAEDATQAYFVAKGVLSGENAEGRSPTPGQPNLYRWRQGAGIGFLATLAGADSNDWGSLGGGIAAWKQTATASPSGRYLAFMSSLPLSGYDNADAKSGAADQEVFLYDAEANGGEGGLLCASCDPGGGRPKGLTGGSANGTAASDPQGLWTGVSLAATLPEASKLENFGAPSVYRSRALHDDGRLFFNVAGSLVAGDSNGNWDVYQYEPSGVGTCTPSSGDAGTARSAGGGCVSLISSGTGEGESAFLDASEGGGDAFFLTAAPLSVTDEDRVTDVYDARVDGIPAKLEPRAECQGEACQPPYIPPNDPTPASASFQGPGNVREGPAAAPRGRCPKGKRKARHKGKVVCAKSHRRQAKHHRRAHR